MKNRRDASKIGAWHAKLLVPEFISWFRTNAANGCHGNEYSTPNQCVFKNCVPVHRCENTTQEGASKGQVSKFMTVAFGRFLDLKKPLTFPMIPL